MTTTPEGKVKHNFNTKLKAVFEKRCWKFMPVQTGYGMQGLDYFLCIAGHFVAVETKKDHKTDLTPRQKATKRDIEAAGGTVYIVYDDWSADLAIANMVFMEKCAPISFSKRVEDAEP